jgi:hypothetical protein
VVIAAVTSCSTPIAKTAAAVELTVKGEQVLLPQELQAQAEAELSYTLNFGYVARTGSSPVGCWSPAPTSPRRWTAGCGAVRCRCRVPHRRRTGCRCPSEAGAGFLAVLPDDGKRTNSELGLSEAREVSLRDDLLSVRATGWGNPRSWHSDDGELRRVRTGHRVHAGQGAAGTEVAHVR